MNNITYKEKSALIVGYIVPGGFQTFLVNILNILKDRNVNIDIYYFEIPNEILIKFPMFNYIKMSPIKNSHKFFSILHKRTLYNFVKKHIDKDYENKFYCSYLSCLAKYQCKIFDSYDNVFSLSEHLNLYLNMNFINAKNRYCWIHPNYRLAKMDNEIDFRYLKKFTKIFAVSSEGCKVLKEIFFDMREKFDYIENIIDINSVLDKGEYPIENPFEDGLRILTVCRMTNLSKRVDRMLEIAYDLEKSGYRFSWVFVGDGIDLPSYKKYIEEKDLKCVKFMGSINNPYPIFKKADLFVLLSDYEGNPYVLKESRIFKIPYLITDFDENLINENLNCFGLKNDKYLIKNAVSFIKGFSKTRNLNNISQENDIRKLIECFTTSNDEAGDI
ncbi:glycosyltransferase [Amedibacillus sp. YH-ame6]